MSSNLRIHLSNNSIPPGPGAPRRRTKGLSVAGWAATVPGTGREMTVGNGAAGDGGREMTIGRSPRLLLLTSLYIPWVGGIENFLRELIGELRRRGFELAVVTSHGAEAPSGLGDVDGVPVLRVPVHTALERRDPGEVLSLEREMARFVADFDPDVVHSHDTGPVLWTYQRSARRSRRPLVVTIHNVMSLHVPTGLPLLGALVSSADAVTAVSRDAAEDAAIYAPSVADRISVITNGVVPTTADWDPVAPTARQVCAIGRLVPQKNFEAAIEAFASVAGEFPDLRLVVAGEGPDDAALADLAAARGLDGRVVLVGAVDRDRVAEIMADSRAVLMPSRYEGSPLVAIEAAWAGRPVVGYRVPGLREAVLDGVSGFLVEPGDVEGMGRALAGCLRDVELARRVGAAARARAEDVYSLARCTDAYQAVYRSVQASG